MVNSTDQDAQHLGMLSIFHYVVGGLKALVACIPCIHFGIGWVMIFVSLFSGDDEALPVTLVGAVFVVVASLLILVGWAVALCIIYAGRCLAERRHYTFCLVIAGIECIFVPFGTILGVFTIIALTRPSVKEMFSS